MEKKQPLVSVIMPAYNCEAYIKQAIQSVINQTYTHWELLVGDDGSVDSTRAIIDTFQDARIIKSHNEINQGNIRTRNRLFEEAKGDYLTILDADDWMDDDKLRMQLKAIQENDLDGCVTNYHSIDVSGRMVVYKNYSSNFLLSTEYLADQTEMSFPPASIMLKKQVYRAIGGLNLYFDRLFAEDKYWIYLLLEKYKILLMKEPLYYYRANPVSLTNAIDNTRKLTITALVEELIRQRRETGRDWLSDGNIELAISFEKKLLKNRIWLAEKYRIYAARNVDLFQLKQSLKFIGKSLLLNPLKAKSFRTLFYLCRTSMHL